MRRLLTSLVVLACSIAVAAGCGGDDQSGSGLEAALAYLPASTPFVATLDTDVEGDQYKAVGKILDRFPGGESIALSLREQIESGAGGVSYAEDVKPLLGNPVVVGATDAESFLSTSNEETIAAFQVEDTDALDRIIEKSKLEERGEVAGATVYENDGSSFAVEDDMVVFAGSREALESALERADGDDHFDVDTFEEGLDGLPEEALTQTYLDVRALLESDPSAAATRRVEWIGALRTAGFTVAAEDDAVDVEFNLRTEGDLSDEDLPLAAGGDAPGVIRIPGEIAVSLRDPSQVFAFFESTFQTLDPQSFGDYETGKRAFAQRYDVDVDRDLVGQLTGDVIVSVALDGTFGARGEVADPQAFSRTVDRLAEALPQTGLGVTGVSRRGGLYEARLANGQRVAFGMSDDLFVAGTNLSRARELASEEPDAVEGASGSLVAAADAQEIAGQVLSIIGRQQGLDSVLGGSLFTGPLNDLTGSIETSTDSMRGKFRLELD